MEGDREPFEGELGRQPSYPLLVFQSLASVPALTVHSDLNSTACSSSGSWRRSWAHPTPCSSGHSMMKESLLESGDPGSVGAEVRDWIIIAWRFAWCTESHPTIESRALESRPEFFFGRGIRGGTAGRLGVTLRSESESDDRKTRSKGTSCPSFFRSLSIFCLRRLLRDVML